MTFTVSLECPACGEETDAEVTFSPERPPPPCSNPDSPAYSDPGDPGEVETDAVCVCGFSFACAEFDDKLYDAALHVFERRSDY